jgi:TonB-dependent receptor
MMRETTGSQGAAAYQANLEVFAGYGQVDFDIVERLHASLGLRYEDATQSVTPKALFAGDPIPFSPDALENSYWLPAATVTWNFAEDMQFRAGLSKTIARPQFRELAPLPYLDPDSDRLFIGNPNLVDSELVNVDFRYEWYFASDQYVTAGVFYKDIDKPVEAILFDLSSNTQTTYLNAPKAVLYGIEVDAKKYFEVFTDSPFFSTKRWLVYGNYTWSKSELQVESGDVVYPITADGSSRPAQDFVNDGDPMQGQSEHLFNFQFGWEDDEAQSQATILVNYASERISSRGRSGFPDLVQDPGVTVDFVYRKGFSVLERDFTFSFEARNLTDEEYEEYQELGGGHVDNNRYALGRSVSFGLSARF